MSNEPIISIVVPVYNVENYIETSLRSAINQSLKNIEIICINDGSTDKSWTIVDALSNYDGRIVKVYCEKNHGPSYVRNLGVKCAKGKYIMFLDADDKLAPNAAERLAEVAECDACDMVLFDFDYSYEDDALAEKYPYVENKLGLYEGTVYNGLELFVSFETNGWPVVTAWSAIYLREFLVNKKLEFQDGIISEDVLFINEAILSADKIRYLNERLYIYFRRSNSRSTRGVSLEEVKSFFIITCKMSEFFLNHKFPPELYPYIGMRIARYAARTYDYYQQMVTALSFADIAFDDEWHNKAFSIFSRLQDDNQKWTIDKSNVAMIKSYENIIVYGAGKIARLAIRHLCYLHIDRFIIAVTQAKEDEYLAGNKVHSIHEVEIDREKTVVLIAVSLILQPRIKKYLRNIGYDNIIGLIG